MGGRAGRLRGGRLVPVVLARRGRVASVLRRSSAGGFFASKASSSSKSVESSVNWTRGVDNRVSITHRTTTSGEGGMI